MGLLGSKVNSINPVLGSSGEIARSIFDFTVESIENKELIHLSKYFEQITMDLLEIFAFPCDNIYFQEPGSNKQIAEFAKSKGAIFPIFGKLKCEKGKKTHPLYKFLKSYKGINPTGKLDWNYVKFLCNADGIPVKRYPSSVSPLDLEADLLEIMNGNGERVSTSSY
eukprot:gene7934-10767_t